jgi:hypothetical protein
VSVRSVQLAYLTARRFQPHRTQGLKLLHDPAFAKSGRGYVESRAHSLDRPSSRRCRLRPVLTPTGGVWAAQPARLRKRNRGRTGCSIVCHAVGITLSSLLSSTWMVSHGVSLQT